MGDDGARPPGSRFPGSLVRLPCLALRRHAAGAVLHDGRPREHGEMVGLRVEFGVNFSYNKQETDGSRHTASVMHHDRTHSDVVTARSPSLPPGAIPRSSRDGPDRTRRACSEEASSVARGGPPAAACCARTYTPACREVGWWWISLPCDAPYARVSRAGAHMRMDGDGAPRHRARRVRPPQMPKKPEASGRVRA